MNPVRKFHIIDILSVSTGRPLSKRGFAGCENVVGHILGRPSITMTLGPPEIVETARQFLETELPWVKEVKFPMVPEGIPKEDLLNVVDRFVNDAASKYGETHEIGQMKRAIPFKVKSDIK